MIVVSDNNDIIDSANESNGVIDSANESNGEISSVNESNTSELSAMTVKVFKEKAGIGSSDYII